jgi:hypothetical protein
MQRNGREQSDELVAKWRALREAPMSVTLRLDPASLERYEHSLQPLLDALARLQEICRRTASDAHALSIATDDAGLDDELTLGLTCCQHTYPTFAEFMAHRRTHLEW